MEDPVEIRRRMQHLIERVARRDAYGTLLADGRVTVDETDVEDPDAWRATIRRHARADRIKVRTGRSGGMLWAMLRDLRNPARGAEGKRYRRTLGVVVPRAVAHRHEPVVVLRDDDQALFGCGRCAAHGYTRTTDDVIFGGDLFDRDCPHDTPPRATALSVLAS